MRLRVSSGTLFGSHFLPGMVLYPTATMLAWTCSSTSSVVTPVTMIPSSMRMLGPGPQVVCVVGGGGERETISTASAVQLRNGRWRRAALPRSPRCCRCHGQGKKHRMRESRIRERTGEIGSWYRSLTEIPFGRVRVVAARRKDDGALLLHGLVTTAVVGWAGWPWHRSHGCDAPARGLVYDGARALQRRADRLPSKCAKSMPHIRI